MIRQRVYTDDGDFNNTSSPIIIVVVFTIIITTVVGTALEDPEKITTYVQRASERERERDTAVIMRANAAATMPPVRYV